MLAGTMGVTRRGAAFAERTRLALKLKDPAHHPHRPGLAGVASEIEQLVGPPNGGDYGSRDAPIHPSLGPHIVRQPLAQQLIPGRGLTQRLAREDPLAGGSRRKVQPEPLDSFLGAARRSGRLGPIECHGGLPARAANADHWMNDRGESSSLQAGAP